MIKNKMFKRISCITIAFIMVINFLPQTVFAINNTEDLLYEVIQNTGENSSEAEIILEVTNTEGHVLEGVVLPDNTVTTAENMETNTFSFTVSKNEEINFLLKYSKTVDGEATVESKEQIVSFLVSGLSENTENPQGSGLSENAENSQLNLEKSNRKTRTSEVELDLAHGSIIISETGYKRNGDANPETPFTGAYRIVGERINASNNTIIVSGGTEGKPIPITLDNVKINHILANPSKNVGSAIAIGKFSTGSHVALTLVGDNSLNAADYGSGIELVGPIGNPSTITIDGMGKLAIQAGKEAAGIGGAYASSKGMACKITVNGGTIITNGGAYGAGIGGGVNSNIADIIINGGDITAKGGLHAAGIGGGRQQVGRGSFGDHEAYLKKMSVTINGGKVTANGGENGAGIGTGLLEMAGTTKYDLVPMTITINDGADVIAKAGNGGNQKGGAGIGTGYALRAIGANAAESIWFVDEININGGKVQATGTGPGAGIGSAENTLVQKINIVKGDITAKSESGAGIGSGERGIVNEINIAGGNVSATVNNVDTNWGAAGIGSGSHGLAEYINIAGGNVSAIAGGIVPNYGAGIGSGVNGQVKDIKITDGKIIASSTGGGAGIGTGSNGKADRILIEGSADITATAGTVGTGIGRGGPIRDDVTNVFPIIITPTGPGNNIKAYARGDVGDADVRTAIDQGCANLAASNISQYILMGDLKNFFETPQEVIVTGLDKSETKLMLPERYSSFASTVSKQNNKVTIDGVRYAGSETMRNEATLTTTFSNKGAGLNAFWMLQPESLHEVSFESNGGTPVASLTGVNSTSLILAPTAPSRAGYIFDGWYKDEALVNRWNFASDRVTENITLYAEWTAKSYAVKYDTQGGTAISDKTNVEFDDSDLVPNTHPTRVGFDFSGWMLDGTNVDSTSVYSTLVADDTIMEVTLVAQWTAKTYAVKYDTQGGSAISDKTNVKFDDSNLLPNDNPTRAGFDFSGWMLDGKNVDSTSVYSTLVADDTIMEVTLVAQWTAKTYAVKYDTQGGTAVSDKTNVKFNDSNLLPNDNPTRIGFVFAGWILDGKNIDSTSVYNTLVADDTIMEVTLVAQWQERSYVVKYDTQGGNLISDKTNIKFNDSNLLPNDNPTRAGFIFAGWKMDGKNVDNTSVYNTLVMDDTIMEVTLVAQWTAKSYVVKYDTQGGTSIFDKTNVKFDDSNLLPNDNPTRDGFVFSGWKMDGKNIDSTSVYNTLVMDDTIMEVTLVAQWTAKSPDIVIPSEPMKPIIPSTPITPSTPSEPSSGTDIPKTDDTSNLGVSFTVMVLSAGLLSLLGVKRKNKYSTEK